MSIPFTVWTAVGDVPASVVEAEGDVGQVFSSIGDVSTALVVADSPLIGQVFTSAGDLAPADL